MEPTNKALKGERQIRQSHWFYTTAIKISTFYTLQILTHTTTFLPPKWYITELFRENVFHNPEALLWSCDLSGEQNVCKNENLDDKNGKLQLYSKITRTPLSIEKLDTCLQQLAFAEREKIPAPRMFPLADCGLALFAKEAKAWESQKFEGSQKMHHILITQLNWPQDVWSNWQYQGTFSLLRVL